MQPTEIATNVTNHLQGDDTENKDNVEQEENNRHSAASKGLDQVNVSPEKVVEQQVGFRVGLVYVYDPLTEFFSQLEGSNNNFIAISTIIPVEGVQMTTGPGRKENTTTLEEFHEQDDTNDQAVRVIPDLQFASQAVTTVIRPLVAACIDMFDMDVRHKNLRLFVTAPPDRLSVDSFSLRMGTWGNRVLHNIGTSYMWATPTPDIQTGTFLWKRGMTREETFVTWNFLFLSEPQFFVGIRSINISDNWRVNMRIPQMDSHRQGFTFMVDDHGSVVLEEVTLQWVATTSNRFRTGTFAVPNTVTLQRPAVIPITFASIDNSHPQVMLGITVIDLQSSVNARVKVSAENITNNTFNIRVETWNKSAIWGLEGRYLLYA
ncbi:hypothetical protein HYPSUDRAFT_75556 [Hypholoma sublateritium FD-334 SS-4]|uniref:H-type lectin domain-containing protein n=1 Tax=Hypholoma sublateritium (strain FD-334 SS-4) TaxID=945553 RepID=A0A0D2MQU9_HYPSF|nr:hypothetical protein HYPSUDRAFT_75556 [Hypholoma sublateritium FD-334 SS-4]